MSDKEIINLLLERANKLYPVALAVHPVLNKELCVQDPYKYRELIDLMVDQELVKNTFGDFIRILPKGKDIVDSGGYLKYVRLHPVKRPHNAHITRSRNAARKRSSADYSLRDELVPLLRSLVAVFFSFFTLHK